MQTQKKALYPNALRKLAKSAGLSIRDIHQETKIPESTLHYWASGKCVIPKTNRALLAQIIGCNAHDLAPQNAQEIPTEREIMIGPFEESNGCFSFGTIKTTSMVLDGDGTEAYQPKHIHTFIDPVPATFFPEVLQAKEEIRQEEQEKYGKLWNSEKYHISKIVMSREPPYEDLVLSLTFKPRDHYTGLATRRCLDDPAFRQKYIPEDWTWNSPIVGMSCSMGVDMAVVSSDGYVLLTQRGQNVSVNQGAYNCSVSEAVSPLLDRRTTGPAPDFYRTASRGFAEELGLCEGVDFSVADIQFLSFSVDTHYALYGMRGMVKVQRSAAEILQTWQHGVKDKLENKKLFIVPFTPQDVCAFVFSHEPWTSGLVSLYHTLVHEFGRREVDKIIASF